MKKLISPALMLSSLALCGSQPQGTAPNILICVADDASHASAYGTRWIDTPVFDSIASRGLLFANAFTCNSKSAPSRASLITGRNSWQLKAAANHWCDFPKDIKTFPEVLDSLGFHVGYTGKGWGPGIAKDSLGNDRLLTGTCYNDIKCQPPTRQINKIDYSANFKQFIEQWDGSRPFCFWYGAREPHRKYEYGSGLRAGKKLSDIDSVPAYWPDNEKVRTDMLDYAFEIEYFDKKLGEMLDYLRSRNLLDNTLIIVTSDNGMPFPRCKGNNYYQATRLPLAMMWAGGIADPGRTVEGYVSLTDIAPTIMDIYGLDAQTEGMLPMSGRSLADILANSADSGTDRGFVLLGRERHDVGRPDDTGYPIRAIIRDNFLYIRNFEPARWPAGNPETGYMDIDGSPTKTEIINDRKSSRHLFWDLSMGLRPPVELYDIGTDPECVTNLATDSAYSQVIGRLDNELTDKLVEQGDPRLTGHPEIFDSYPNMCPQHQFWNRLQNGEKMKTGWISPTDFDAP